ncbi:MAG: hypothetical protein JSR17_09320 [Proteobacteria bacterium]|nr:hypothetical protein [Pseudomonadota bacterium]
MKTNEQFVLDIANEINKLYKNKRDAMSGKMPPREGASGKRLPLGGQALVEIPSDIEKVHKLIQSAIQTNYLLNNKLDIPEDKKVDFEALVTNILTELANANKKEPAKKAASTLTVGGGGGAVNQFESTYNKIVELKESMVKQRIDVKEQADGDFKPKANRME